ncbi:prolyl oligopeptidase family serine peptidase [Iodidimonas gelatinilytica]|uniref:prolyl oligopeptidase family serine peptidase n=1 Tax=Iodidimonas gelatinilytica TaxID=1236966 RepID=UPI0027D94FFE|nr:prolyl oligopeptidase family serine peptidase [Iodidimonas gelatinilytica]
MDHRRYLSWRGMCRLGMAASVALTLAACDAQNSEKSTKESNESVTQQTQSGDPYLWLEEVEGDKALEWARTQNTVSLARLEGDPRYEDIRAAAEKIRTASDRIPYGQIIGDEVRNFWQDDTHVRGIWRRTSLESYQSESPQWEVILDLDALAETEGENWVWKGASCLAPDNRHCMVNLSRGGADAVVSREFDAQSGRFVEDGFYLAEEKQSVSWIDADRLFVASPHAGGSKNTSGYARTVRIWQRGSDLAAAETLFSSAETDAFTFPVVIHRPEGTELFISRAPDFFHETLYHVGSDNKLTELALPDDANFQGLFKGRVIALLRSEWTVGDVMAPAGAVVSLPLDDLLKGTASSMTIIAKPTDSMAIEGVQIGRDAIYVALLDQVRGRLAKAQPTAEGWTLTDADLPKTGNVSIVSGSGFTNTLLVNFERFLEPDTLYLIDETTAKPIKAMPARFDASAYEVAQHFATSDDGTNVPYFLIRAKDTAMDGSTPTILYGYGGFEISLTPNYLSPLAIEWLKQGGAYAVANIRGGGEFGPRWHKAALNENRPRAYEDFASVARDLIDQGLTSAPHLGIYGGSNGGLLTGATMVRNPELFGAVVSAVPLLDMLRYHKLLAGASWIGEYGDPDIPAERAWIETYSPYQNVSKDVTYPPVFFTTSTRDDRVHPGHARKMAAKMMQQGHEVLYYENIEGGHAGAANLKQGAMRDALIVTWFLQELKDAD